MSFVVYNPNNRASRVGLPDDACTLTKGGTLTLPQAPLEKLQIVGAAVVLFDVDSARLALRKVHDGEESTGLKIRATKELERRGLVNLHVAGALKQAGWETGKGARYFGRRQTTVRADGLLIIHLDRKKEDRAVTPDVPE